jgi:hypothetical protein
MIGRRECIRENLLVLGEQIDLAQQGHWRSPEIGIIFSSLLTFPRAPGAFAASAGDIPTAVAGALLLQMPGNPDNRL